jgi:hypothetical protein
LSAAIAIDLLDKEFDQRADSSILFVPDKRFSEEKDVYSSTVESVIMLLKQNTVPANSLHPIDPTTLLPDNRCLDRFANECEFQLSWRSESFVLRTVEK